MHTLNETPRLVDQAAPDDAILETRLNYTLDGRVVGIIRQGTVIRGS